MVVSPLLGIDIKQYLIVSAIISLIFYIYCGITIMFIAKKTNTPKSWFAFIPFLNVLLTIRISGINEWWILIFFAGFIPFVGALAIAVVCIWVFWRIAEKVGFPGWTSLLLLIPVANLIIIGMYAWAKK